jgi:cell wall-associated NlpC family hydrolase
MGSATRVSIRRTLAGAAASLTLMLAAPAGASAGPANAEEDAAFRVLGSTVLAAFGSSVPDHAVTAIGNSLALLGARYRIESGEMAATKASSGTPQTAAPPPDEVVEDPSTLPPASAGSNGTVVPHTSAMSRDEIFAHTRGDGGSNAILLSGVALPPPDAPEAIKNVINNANTIVGRPYIWGGGHGSWYSNGYDCSGSVSFALFGGGLIPRPLTSGELEGWGAPGPGKWITVYANAGHTFAEIAGLRWDTVGDAQGTGPRWHLASTATAGFVARHPPGL